MRVVILAGGRGTRLQEETRSRPKPMVEIGDKPILWHIMKHYAHHDLREFVIALGYLGEYIKEYFLNWYHLSGDLTIDLGGAKVRRQARQLEDWMVHLVETGTDTLTGGRIKRLEPWLRGGTFMATYGDGVCDIDLHRLLAFHRAHGRLATVTAVHPPARFGRLEMDGDVVVSFAEKPVAGEGWINGGYFVFEPGVFDYMDGDFCSLEGDVLERLTADRQLTAFRHQSFWQCMDTLREKHYLERLWQEGAPWKVWETPARPASRKAA